MRPPSAIAFSKRDAAHTLGGIEAQQPPHPAVECWLAVAVEDLDLLPLKLPHPARHMHTRCKVAASAAIAKHTLRFAVWILVCGTAPLPDALERLYDQRDGLRVVLVPSHLRRGGGRCVTMAAFTAVLPATKPA